MFKLMVEYLIQALFFLNTGSMLVLDQVRSLLAVVQGHGLTKCGLTCL